MFGVQIDTAIQKSSCAHRAEFLMPLESTCLLWLSLEVGSLGPV